MFVKEMKEIGGKRVDDTRIGGDEALGADVVAFRGLAHLWPILGATETRGVGLLMNDDFYRLNLRPVPKSKANMVTIRCSNFAGGIGVEGGFACPFFAMGLFGGVLHRTPHPSQTHKEFRLPLYETTAYLPFEAVDGYFILRPRFRLQSASFANCELPLLRLSESVAMRLCSSPILYLISPSTSPNRFSVSALVV